jgi:hypothetical protein
VALLIEYKWVLLFSSELIAWIATFYMFLARYWFESKLLFIIFAMIAGFTGYVPHIVLAAIDYYFTKEVNFFPFVIALILLLGIILTKKYMMKIDQAVMKWVQKRKSKTIRAN